MEAYNYQQELEAQSQKYKDYLDAIYGKGYAWDKDMMDRMQYCTRDELEEFFLWKT